MLLETGIGSAGGTQVTSLQASPVIQKRGDQ